MAKNKEHKTSCACEEQDPGDIVTRYSEYIPAIVSFVMLAAGILVDRLSGGITGGAARVAWYAATYLPVGLPVIVEAWETLRKGEFFTEYTLMVVATLGAFAIGDYAEGVAVMLFYAVGELFQSHAVNKVTRSIKSLLETQPSVATVVHGDMRQVMAPETVEVGETIEVRAGEKVPLDGVMLSPEGSFNTAALTGESRPDTIREGEQVLAGMVNTDKVIQIRVTKPFEDSSLSRILHMVQQATARKAKTELMIRRFARVYTPTVFGLALALIIVPYFFAGDYAFSEWLYRALIFLVVSCPCALVISIPLGYFGGIGAGSRSGILFKGSNYLDVMARVNTVVMDKTGTMTEGVFKVRQVNPVGTPEKEFTKILATLERSSTHPIAKAIADYAGSGATLTVTDIKEIAGEGLRGKVDGVEVLAGNTRLLRREGVKYDAGVDSIPETVVACAIDGQYAGHVIIADRLKKDAAQAVADMKRNGVTLTMMLSGDKDPVTQQAAREAGIDKAYGGLLPAGKVECMEEIKQDPSRIVAFVGDGINDAPVLAMSDVGIAMGAMGSDAAIETADVVIQSGQPSKIAAAIRIGRATRRIVYQNIALAMGVKALVMILGAFGIATMWEAVFADVGVALLAILNAVRIQRMKF